MSSDSRDLLLLWLFGESGSLKYSIELFGALHFSDGQFWLTRVRLWQRYTQQSKYTLHFVLHTDPYSHAATIGILVVTLKAPVPLVLNQISALMHRFVPKNQDWLVNVNSLHPHFQVMHHCQYSRVPFLGTSV
jgi:hypothetical protein